MGQVYRATDTKLKRQVAIKILPPLLAADPDRLARFQREAEVLASLNHPNIAAIYGLEEVRASRPSSWSWSRATTCRSGLRAAPSRSMRPFRSRTRLPTRSKQRTTEHHPSRFEAREHQSPRRRHGRCSTSGLRGLRPVTYHGFGSDEFANDQPACDTRWRDPRDGSLHES